MMKTSAGMLLLVSGAVLGLSACGVETVTTAATVATMKAEEVKEAQRQKERVEKKLEEANRIAAERMQNMDAATRADEETP
jgi:ribosomal protein L44E